MRRYLERIRRSQRRILEKSESLVGGVFVLLTRAFC